MKKIFSILALCVLIEYCFGQTVDTNAVILKVTMLKHIGDGVDYQIFNHTHCYVFGGELFFYISDQGIRNIRGCNTVTLSDVVTSDSHLFPDQSSADLSELLQDANFNFFALRSNAWYNLKVHDIHVDSDPTKSYVWISFNRVAIPGDTSILNASELDQLVKASGHCN
jgi:hypothetical protein